MEGNGGSDSAEPRRSLAKRPSSSNILGERTAFESINISKINALRASVNRQYELASRIILTSKETAKRRGQVDTALRVCRDAFLEVSTVLVNLLDEKSNGFNVEDIKRVVQEAFEHGQLNMARVSRPI